MSGAVVEGPHCHVVGPIRWERDAGCFLGRVDVQVSSLNVGLEWRKILTATYVAPYSGARLLDQHPASHPSWLAVIVTSRSNGPGYCFSGGTGKNGFIPECKYRHEIMFPET